MITDVTIFQFKIALYDTSPPIWRRIQVPGSYSFWDLHVAIQDAMGWEDCHLHEFEIIAHPSGDLVCIGFPDEDFGRVVLAGWKNRIAKHLSLDNPNFSYKYDFGDDWEHIMQLENVSPREEAVDYPRCIEGDRACPPEDCGGVGGYYNLVEAMKDPESEQYEEMIEWLGEEYDPEVFDPNEVLFDDPATRLKNVQR